MGLMTTICERCITMRGPAGELFPGMRYTFTFDILFKKFLYDTPSDFCAPQTLFRDSDVLISYQGSTAKYGVDFLGPTKIILQEGTNSGTFIVDVFDGDGFQKDFKITATGTGFAKNCAIMQPYTTTIHGLLPSEPVPEVPDEVKPSSKCYEFFTDPHKAWTKCNL